MTAIRVRRFGPSTNNSPNESHQQAFFSGVCFATRFLLQLQRASDPSEAIPSVDDLVAELRQFHKSHGIATIGDSEEAGN